MLVRLTEPQRRLYQSVVDAGVRRFNGRAARMIEALERAGLVTADWDLHLGALGGSLWRIEVRPVLPALLAPSGAPKTELSLNPGP